jgi:hypothetical protein
MTERLYDGDTFEHRGYTFRVTFPRDEQYEEPWKAHDGHGIVSDWTTREKRAGERVLASDRQHKRYYDVQATIALARRDGWGPVHCRVCGEESGGAGSSMYGTVHKYGPVEHGPFVPESKRQQAARAVEADFEYCRAWCADEWEWLGVVVELVEDPEKRASVWGIESLSTPEYFAETAYELADEVLSTVEVDEPRVQLSEN